MPFRNFSAHIILEQGKIIKAESSDPEKLYPKTFLKYVIQMVEQLITNDCQSGQLKITSKADKILVVAFGDLKKCRKAIIDKMIDIFEVDTWEE